MTDERHHRLRLKVAIVASVAIAVAPAAGAQGQVEDGSDAHALTGMWAQQVNFSPALQGELLLRREGATWRAEISGSIAPCQLASNRLRCVFPGARGEFRGSLEAASPDVAGWWLRPSGETVDRRDPGGSGQPFATLANLTAAGRDVWRGIVKPLPDRFTLYLRIFRNAGELEDVEVGELVAVFRNPELNSIGEASYYNVAREGHAVRFFRKLPDGGEIRHDAMLVGPPERLRISWPDAGGSLDLMRRTPADASGFYPRPPMAQKYAYRKPADIGDGWPTASAGETGLNEGKLAAVVQSLIDADPSVRRPSLIHSMLVAHRGKLVLEEYFYGYNGDTPHDMRSAGKTFASVMLGAAMLQGVAISPETRIYELLADRGPFANPDPRKGAITLAHLMTHTSGLDCDDNSEASLGNEGTMTRQREQPDWWKYTLDLPMVHDPGKHYAYCSANTNLVGGALTKGTGTWLPELFERSVARPLQFRRYHWPLTPTGEGYQAGGSFVLPRDLLKLGQTYLDGGIWNGRRIVSAEWVSASTARRIDITPATTGLSPEEFANNYSLAADGYTWHLNDLRVGERIYKEYEASGNGGQLLIVVPGADLTVVFTGGNYLQGGIWGQWRQKIVAEQLMPAIRGLSSTAPR